MHTGHYNLITDFKTGKPEVGSQNEIKLSCFDPKCHAQVPDRLQCLVEKSSYRNTTTLKQQYVISMANDRLNTVSSIFFLFILVGL